MVLKFPRKDILLIYKKKQLSCFSFYNQSFNFLKLNLSNPIIKKNKKIKIIIEDLETHPMNLAARWGILQNLPNYQPSDNQKRLIITVNNADDIISFIIPKYLGIREPLACVSISKENMITPFEIEIFEYYDNKIKTIKPRKIKATSKIILCAQILGHTQDAAKVLQWSWVNNSLQKWTLALPPTNRTEVTKSLLKETGIPIKKYVYDWTYAGGKDFRTGLEYLENFNKKESFDTVTSFVAANLSICRKIAQGKFAVVSTNFRGESQIFKTINNNIITCGISHTFLNGKLADRIKLHQNIPKLKKMLQEVQSSINYVPKIITKLGGNEQHIDYYWKICEEKIQKLDFLIFRAFNFNARIATSQNKTQIIQIPMALPNLKISKTKSRKIISSIIEKDLKPEEKIVTLSGESDDGAFKERLEGLISFAKNHKDVHILIPLSTVDERISRHTLTNNIHPIGFRKDWRQIIVGSDAVLIRGSWGEIIDLISAGTVPVFASLGTVPVDASLDKTQFLTQVSEERACNISLLIEALQANGVKTKTINKLIIDFKNKQGKHSVDQVIKYALLPRTAKEIKASLCKIPRSTNGTIGEIHEQLLRQRRIFSPTEIKKIQNKLWRKKIKFI